jgi:uncharacterized repeat protein (TIGR02543 family)
VPLNPTTFLNQAVESSFTLYAKWTKYIFTVIFDPVTNEDPLEIEVNEGTHLVRPPFTKEGYDIEGWYLSDDEGVTLTTPWNFDTNTVSNDMTLYAKWVIKQFTVTFIDLDIEIKQVIVDYGQAAIAPDDPSKEGYTFSGWDVDFSNVTTNIVVKAIYEVNTYMLIYYAEDAETIVQSTVYDYGADLSGHEEPSAPEKVGHTFNGWEALPSLMPASDVIRIASYTINQYTVTFYDEDEVTILGTSTVTHGSSATPPANPTKAATKQYTYTFTGWHQAFIEVTEDMSTYATYQATLNQYTITFKDFNGNVLQEETLDYGAIIIAPTEPVREGYTFGGWSLLFETVTDDLTIYATYTTDQHQVLYYLEDGITILQSTVYEFGADLSDHDIPSAPLKEGYTFNGWEVLPSLMPASDVIRIASYTINQYTVTFYDEDEVTILGTSTVTHGSSATPPVDPTKTATKQYTYTFTGWHQAFIEVTEDMSTYATYQATLNQYTITFKDFNGNVLQEETLDYGAIIIAPTEPIREGYTFGGWSLSFETVTDDLTIYATYTTDQHQVLYYLEDGITILQSTVYEFGADLSHHEEPSAPLKEGYTFDGWEALPSTMPASDVIRIASYTINQYTVTFYDEDEVTILGTSTVTHGAPATPPENPTKEGYRFDGWNLPFNTITNHMSITARYMINTYNLIYYAEDGTTIVQSTGYLYNASLNMHVAPTAPVKEGYTFNGWQALPKRCQQMT